jgi:hypothetical protein
VSLVSKLLPPDHLKLADDLGGSLNDFSACCLTIVMRCAIDAKDENKEVDTVLNLYRSILALLYRLFVRFY